jgi:glycosyltransferase involved in cell wall biosynthesis
MPLHEIIIVDDGSSDNTEAVVKRLGKDILYLKQKNQGPAAARNHGIQQASGDWIAFLDADDQWVPNKIELQLNCLRKYPELVLIAGDMSESIAQLKVDIPSMLSNHGQRGLFKQLDGAPLTNACASLVDKNFIPTGTVLANKDILIETGLFPETIRFGEDLALWVQVAARHPITCLPDVLMLRRRHDSNATDSNEGMLKGIVQVMRLLKEKCGDVLQQQGITVNESLALACFSLGYWQFHNGQIKQSNNAFREAWSLKKSFKTGAYLTLGYLPDGFANKIIYLLKQ